MAGVERLFVRFLLSSVLINDHRKFQGRATDISSPVFYMLKPDADKPLLQESEMA
jgi:hypothetical protein